jgi:hypothetical protein
MTYARNGMKKVGTLAHTRCLEPPSGVIQQIKHQSHLVGLGAVVLANARTQIFVNSGRFKRQATKNASCWLTKARITLLKCTSKAHTAPLAKRDVANGMRLDGTQLALILLVGVSFLLKHLTGKLGHGESAPANVHQNKLVSSGLSNCKVRGSASWRRIKAIIIQTLYILRDRTILLAWKSARSLN